MIKQNQNDTDDSLLSAKHSVMIWVLGALLGWSVAVASVYSFSKDDQIYAQDKPLNNIDQKAKELNDTMTAAGSKKPKK
jgi:hypothetical protein